MTTTLPPILGHASQMDQLWQALAADRLHHALLFEGPDGIGRRLVATRLAMAANCDVGLPCGQCPTCRRIAAGTHPDVVFVGPPADSTTGTIPVDRVREVIHTAAMHRFSARRRFIIIDPAEGLQPGAANAMLKTLEEPNEGTHFVLIARHSGSLLPTIVSRCQRVRFAPVPEVELVPWLTGRGVAAPETIARLCGGCPGGVDEWTEGGLEERVRLRADLLTALASDLEGLMKFTEQITEGSRATTRPVLERTLALLEDLLRDASLYAGGRDARVINHDIPEVVRAWSTALWPGGIRACASALATTRAQLALNVTSRTALDALLTRIATELGPHRRVVPANAT